jgi:hypothetical protein
VSLRDPDHGELRSSPEEARPFVIVEPPQLALKPQNLVKPRNRKSPRESSTFAWRMSYAPTAILDVDHTKSLPRREAFSIQFFFARNPFDCTILAVTLLE